MKALGHFAGPHNPPLLDFHKLIIHFIKALQSPSGPSSDKFDCLPDNHIAIKTNRLFWDIVYIDKFFEVQPCAFKPNWVTFCTVQLLCDIYLRSSLGDIVTIVPIRLSNYIFKASDYDVYVRHCAMILSSPRGRAALLRGGIIGCLAREHLAIDSACLGFNIVDGDGRRYWDDELTDDEINVICGLHRCYTGM